MRPGAAVLAVCTAAFAWFAGARARPAVRVRGTACSAASAIRNAPLLDERLDRPGHPFLMAQGPEAAGQPATSTQTGLVPVPPSSKRDFDWQQMQRWRVPAADHGREIQFRNALWSRYRVEILLIAAALCLQTGLIAWLIIEHRRRQRAELQSRNAMAELTRLDRRAGAGALSASIAHEVSQPLAAISARTGAALRWLRAEKPDIERASAALEHVVAATRRASDVVDGVSAMFKKDATVRLPIDVNELVLTILSIGRVELRRSGVEVQTCLSERLPTVLGARAQLQQVVLNLMMNAIEAMQPARVRVLKMSTAESKPGIVRVSIQDSGTGVPAEHRARLVEARLKTQSKGKGVGRS